jgi:hypothetical protein
MKRALTVATLLLFSALPAAAQTKGRFSVGGTVTFVQPTDSDVGSLVGIGGLVRLNPKKGWGLAAGLSWFRADSFAVRPGVGVTWTVAERVAIIGFAGYSYNRPDIVYRDVTGQEYRNQWKADAILLSVGAVYSLF